MEEELELYIHIPFCKQKCYYCDFLSFAGRESHIILYIDCLIKEIKAMRLLAVHKTVTSVFIGGGTPSILEGHLIEKVMNAVLENYTVKQDAEITIEANPKTLTKDKLLRYKKSGIERLSIGLQSSDNEMLRKLGRIHTYEDFLENYNLARTCGFTNINIDYMSGLPGQSVADYEASLRKILELQPEHISAYSLIIEENTPFYSKYESDVLKRQMGKETIFLPNEECEYEITKRTQDLLKNKGYLQYEISNFAKKGYECKHNIGYWQRKDYLGFGLGAASCYQNIRFNNKDQWKDYLEIDWTKKAQLLEDSYQVNVGHKILEKVLLSLDKIFIQHLSRKEQMEEYMFLGLRLTQGVSKVKFAEQFSMSLDEIYKEQLEQLLREKLLEEFEEYIVPTKRGMELNNYVCAMFLQD